MMSAMRRPRSSDRRAILIWYAGMWGSANQICQLLGMPRTAGVRSSTSFAYEAVEPLTFCAEFTFCIFRLCHGVNAGDSRARSNTPARTQQTTDLQCGFLIQQKAYVPMHAVIPTGVVIDIVVENNTEPDTRQRRRVSAISSARSPGVNETNKLQPSSLPWRCCVRLPSARLHQSRHQHTQRLWCET
jgi:hypothetical protein